MDLSTNYLGLKLANPFITGASPLTDDIDTVRQLEDCGAAAIVMRSLFEERMNVDAHEEPYYEQIYARSDDSAQYPAGSRLAATPMHYLERLARVKRTVKVPVIASINCTGPGEWIDYAPMIQQAGADALELNVFYVATDPDTTSEEVERRVIEAATLVRGCVSIPIAVKLCPFYSALPNLVRRLDMAGLDGVILFNRSYQPDLDVARRTIVSSVRLTHVSDQTELRQRLRWLAILSPITHMSIAVSGGVHTGLDAVKCIMAGAHAVQVVSSLLNAGPTYLNSLIEQLTDQMVRAKAESVAEIRGCLNLGRTSVPSASERAHYVTALNSWPKR